MLDRFELEFPSWKTNAARLGFCCEPNSSMQVHNLRWRSMTEWPKEPRILSKCLCCVGIQHQEKSKKLRKEASSIHQIPSRLSHSSSHCLDRTLMAPLRWLLPVVVRRRGRHRLPSDVQHPTTIIPPSNRIPRDIPRIS